MNYYKSLFFNFLAVFFANYILPGINVINTTKLPHLGSEIPFAIAAGALNSLIYPILKKIGRRVNAIRIGLIALSMNFVTYAILKILPLGIHVTSIEGYLFASLFVAAGGFLTNYLVLRSANHSGRGNSSHSDHSIKQEEIKKP